MIKNKIKTIRELIKAYDAEAFLINSSQNMQWLTTIEASAGYILITSKDAAVYLDGRYIEAAKKMNLDIKIKDYMDFFKDIKKSGKNIIVESDYIKYGTVHMLQEKYGINTIPYHSAELRIIKDDHEIKMLQKAADITVQVFDKIKKWIKPGMTEVQVSRKISILFLELGADKNSFEPIVASGPNGAYPHHRDSERKITDGEYVTLDFGCSYKGYASDMTRTILIGKEAKGQAKKVAKFYELVKKGQEDAIKACAIGKTGKEIDAIARKPIQEAGFDFSHGTGHGIGLDVHEVPVISPRSEDILLENMAFTVEPGIYVPGIGGVRIEDDIILTTKGPIVLTKKAKK